MRQKVADAFVVKGDNFREDGGDAYGKPRPASLLLVAEGWLLPMK